MDELLALLPDDLDDLGLDVNDVDQFLGVDENAEVIDTLANAPFENAAAATTMPTTAASASSMAAVGACECGDARTRVSADYLDELRREDERRRDLGFTFPVVLQQLPEEPFAPHAWLYSDAGAATVFCSEARAQQVLLRMTDPTTRGLPAPPVGMGNIVELPRSFEEITFAHWMHNVPRIEATNSVATFHTGMMPNMTNMVYRATPFAYNVRRFAATPARITNGTVMVFTGGKAVITGPKGGALSRIAAQEYTSNLNSIGIPASMKWYVLQNIVFKVSSGFQNDLIQLQRAYPLNVSYKPKRFPGAIMRFDGVIPIVMIIFKTQKIIITGARNLLEAMIMWMWLWSNVLREFQLRSTANHHLTEAAYRRSVAAEAVIIDLTCEQLHAEVLQEVETQHRDAANEPETDDTAPAATPEASDDRPPFNLRPTLDAAVEKLDAEAMIGQWMLANAHLLKPKREEQTVGVGSSAANAAMVDDDDADDADDANDGDGDGEYDGGYPDTDSEDDDDDDDESDEPDEEDDANGVTI